MLSPEKAAFAFAVMALCACVCVDCNACVWLLALLYVLVCACFDLLAGDARVGVGARRDRIFLLPPGANARECTHASVCVCVSLCSLTVLTCILASIVYVHSEINHAEAALANEATKDEVHR